MQFELLRLSMLLRRCHPIAPAPPINASPVATTRGAPKRLINRPVKKLGAYIPMTCHAAMKPRRP
jgi:hypothetical protein